MRELEILVEKKAYMNNFPIQTQMAHCKEEKEVEKDKVSQIWAEAWETKEVKPVEVEVREELDIGQEL